MDEKASNLDTQIFFFLYLEQRNLVPWIYTVDRILPKNIILNMTENAPKRNYEEQNLM